MSSTELAVCKFLASLFLVIKNSSSTNKSPMQAKSVALPVCNYKKEVKSNSKKPNCKKRKGQPQKAKVKKVVKSKVTAKK